MRCCQDTIQTGKLHESIWASGRNELGVNFNLLYTFSKSATAHGS